MKTDKSERIDKSRACLILGAVGDSLGAAVELMKRDEIIARYGDSPGPVKGIQIPDVAYGVKGAITDDTQMTLFAADGLISAFKRGRERGILGEYYGYTTLSYLKWLETQGETNPNYTVYDGWGSAELFELIKSQGRRGPGNTCLGALRTISSSEPTAHNDSKGCGTVMRVAPVGIFFGNQIKDTSSESLQKVYLQGMKDAAITHGNETAQHASGFLAVIFALLLNGEELEEAVNIALGYFGDTYITEFKDLIINAVQLSKEAPSSENLQKLGEGWIAEEALSLSLYCSLICTKGSMSVEDSLRLAVNHDGDSDSVGAITGNLIGASLGTKSIPTIVLGADTEVSSIIPTLKKYGTDLIEIADYQLGML